MIAVFVWTVSDLIGLIMIAGFVLWFVGMIAWFVIQEWSRRFRFWRGRGKGVLQAALAAVRGEQEGGGK